jgi:branched-chain amino acid transport system substrate-binding protein
MMPFVPNVHAEPLLKISMSLGLTGKYAGFGDMQQKGFKLWERDVNGRGGILGRPVQLTIHDDKSDPAIAAELYKRFIVQDKVDLVFAPYSSELTAAVVSTTEKYGFPMLASGVQSEALWKQGYRYLFGVTDTTSNSTVGFLELLVNNGIDSIAIINADDMFSQEAGKRAREWAKRFGLQVIFVEEFKKGTSDLDWLVQKAQASNAQVLMVCGHFDEAVNVRRALKRIGWSPRAYYATVGPALLQFHEVLKADADGTFSSPTWELNAPFAGAKEFVASFNKTYHGMPSSAAATAYATGQILEAAVKNVKSFDREKIRESLLSLDASTVLGRYGVDPAGKQIRQFPITIQWQNGIKQIVAPKEIVTAKPIWK